jgi:predicted RNA-binding protein with PUA-like domain
MVKQEPETYSWDDLVRDGRTDWSGVRNFQARNNLRAMREGDHVLFYHSGKQKAVVGVARVVREAYADPTAGPADDWVAVDLEAVKGVEPPVPLASLRYDERLKNLPLLRQTQLSVMPLARSEYTAILTMSNGRHRA